MDEINSITGRDIPHISPSRDDRRQLVALIALFGPTASALRHADWLAVTFWLIGMTGCVVVRPFRQRPAMTQKSVLAVLWTSAFVLVFTPAFLPGAADWVIPRVIGLAIAPIPWLVVWITARRSRNAA